MPGYDGTGPEGTGPAGRGLGPCGQGKGGRGIGFFGFRRGRRGGRRGFWWGRSDFNDKESLNAEKNWLEERLKSVNDQLDRTEKE